MRARASSALLAMLVFTMAVCAILSFNAGSRHAAAAQEPAVSDIGLSPSRDFLYASQPQSPTEDSVTVTAQLYVGGKPLRRAGMPVDFGLSDGRFATLDENRVYTDEWGTASTNVRSYNSGQPLPDRPFLLAVGASAGGKSSQVTLPITDYISLGGTVTNKTGSPVGGATVSLLYNRTHVPITASGSTTTTDIDGKYYLDRVPTDLGGVIIYVKKGDLETSISANFSGTGNSMRVG